MSRRSVKFGDKKVNASNFYKSRSFFKLDNIDFNKILISKTDLMVKRSFKYFIWYSDKQW